MQVYQDAFKLSENTLHGISLIIVFVCVVFDCIALHWIALHRIALHRSLTA